MSEVLSHLETLTADSLSDILQPIAFIDGIIFAVASAPEIPMPQTWMPWTFARHGQLPNNEQADQLADALMAILQAYLSDMRAGTPLSFPDLQYEDMQSPEDKGSQWLQGLLAAHTQLESVWQLAWQRASRKEPEALESMQKRLKHALMMFSTFSDLPFACVQAEKKGNTALLDKLPSIARSLPLALNEYVKLSGELVRFLPDQFETFTQGPPN